VFDGILIAMHTNQMMILDISNKNTTSSTGNNNNTSTSSVTERQQQQQQQQQHRIHDKEYSTIQYQQQLNYNQQPQLLNNSNIVSTSRTSTVPSSVTASATPPPPPETIVVISPMKSSESIMIQNSYENDNYKNDNLTRIKNDDDDVSLDDKKNNRINGNDEGESDYGIIESITTSSQNEVLVIQQQKTTKSDVRKRSDRKSNNKTRYRSVSPLRDDYDDDDDNNNDNNNRNSISPRRLKSREGSIKSIPHHYSDDENEGIFRGDHSFRNFSTSSIRDAIRELRSAIHEQTNTGTMTSSRYQQKNGTSSRSTTALLCYCCRLLYHTFHTVLLIVLIVAVIMLSYQVRAVQNHLDQEEKDIATLQKQIITQQHSQQNLNEKVVQEHSYTMYQVAGTFTLLTCLITMFHMTQHISEWNEPVIQSKIITILWMSPIYSITSWLSLVFPTSAGYLSVIKDFYEAFVIYAFLSFLIAVLGRGNRDVAIRVLSYHSNHLNTPTKLFTSCYHPPPELNDQAKAGAVLLECQIWTMQFVLLRPFTSVARFILEQHAKENLMTNNTSNRYLTDTPSDSSGSTNNYIEYIQSSRFIIDMITNISVFLAFHGLLKFYHAVHHNLQWCKPFSKFLTIKGIVFLTFWQGLTISILCNLDKTERETNHYHHEQQIVSNNNNNDNIQHRFLRYIVATVLNATNTNVTNDGYDPTITNFTDIVTNYTNLTDDYQGNMTFTNGTYAPYYDTDDSANNNDDVTFTFSSSDPNEESARIQNFLICLEMLFFSLAHWCVYSAEEWKPDYRPPDKPYAKPGIGLKDFANDIGYIVNSSTSARAYNKEQRQQRKKQRQLEQQQEQNNSVLQTRDSLNDATYSTHSVNNVGSDEDDDTSMASNMTPDMVIQTIENNDGTISTMKSVTSTTTTTDTAGSISSSFNQRRFFGGWGTGRRRARYENIHSQQQQQRNIESTLSMTNNTNSNTLESQLYPVLEPDSSFVIDDDDDADEYNNKFNNNDHTGVELCNYNNSVDDRRITSNVIPPVSSTLSSSSSSGDENTKRNAKENYIPQIS
jgi:Organic solute transporter Ostalpha